LVGIIGDGDGIIGTDLIGAGAGAGIIGTDLIGAGAGITGVVMDGMEIIIITMVAEEGIRMLMPIVAIETHQEIQVLIM